jgi:hypothetical protein
MTELRAETVRTIDATQEGLDRSLRSIEGRLKAAEEKLEGVLFWSRIPSCVCTQVPLKRATLNTGGRGCVARSPDKEGHHQTSSQHSSDVILTASGGLPVVGTPNATHEGIIFYFLFGVMFLFSMFSFLEVAGRVSGRKS